MCRIGTHAGVSYNVYFPCNTLEKGVIHCTLITLNEFRVQASWFVVKGQSRHTYMSRAGMYSTVDLAHANDLSWNR